MSDDFDIEDDLPGDGPGASGPAAPERPSLREVWDNNPLLKLAAIALAGAVALGGYFILAPAGSGDAKESMVRLGEEAAAEQIPGQQELDPAYRKALEEENRKTAEMAAETGTSAMPTPIGTAKQGGLDIPAMPEKMKSDPLSEWRRATEGRQTQGMETKVACADDELNPDKTKTDINRLASEKMSLNAMIEEAKRRAAANGTTVEEELRKMGIERGDASSMLDEARRRAAKNGTTVAEELAKMAAESDMAGDMLAEAKRRAAANGTTVEEELAKMAAERATLEEAKRRAAANGTTVEQELAKMKAEADMLAEAKRRAAANGTTVEEELAKMAANDPAAKAMLDEARRRAAANGTTVEEELKKMMAERAGASGMLDEAKRRAARNGTTVEEELKKMAAEQAALAEAKRRAAANGTTVEQELAKMKAEADMLAEAKRRAAANGTTVEEELAKMKAEADMLAEAKRRAALNGTTVEEELRKMAEEAGGDDAKRRLIDEAIRRMTSAASPATAPPEQPQMLPPARPQQAAAMMMAAGSPAGAARPVDPKAEAAALTEQMRVIIAAQAPVQSKQIIATNKPSAYTEQQRAEEAAKAAQATSGASADSQDGGGGSNGGQGESDKVIVAGGSVAYAQLLNELNSDVAGPVVAQILSGPFAGGRAIGKVEAKTGTFSEYMVLTFTQIIKDTVSYTITGIALDEKTTLAGHATDVDHHYFTRIILPAAAKFIEGYGSAVAETGSTTTQTAGGGQATEAPPPSPKESIYKGIEESSKKMSELFAKNAERPVTIKVAKGTTMGILFIDSVTTKDAGQ